MPNAQRAKQRVTKRRSRRREQKVLSTTAQAVSESSQFNVWPTPVG